MNYDKLDCYTIYSGGKRSVTFSCSFLVSFSYFLTFHSKARNNNERLKDDAFNVEQISQYLNCRKL